MTVESICAPSPIHESSVEWRAVCREHHNVLLEGAEAATQACVAELEPLLGVQSVRRRHGHLEFPTGATTLILREVSTLAMHEQSQLLDWWIAGLGRPRLVSTSSEPLFARVERGLFAEALYYKLNVILVRV
jgi:transcriptional regulator of aromatic amino acid metabolism